ncbi:MAG TPA: crosslink repair DNA glycosylase YcaQ family protein, partial [Solirubrobacteraceae bacterium]|nr:crosslink repair DNA glycosylase YcaQ family protein [Solirubrobacteraceae bacterium]
MTVERVLSERELNRAVLARQCLLERSPATVPRTLERIGAIQAQYAPSMYVGLWSRMHALGRADVTAALVGRRAVQATLMRVTIHLVARSDFWPYALATRSARRALWLRSRRGAVDDAAMQEAAQLVGDLLRSRDLLHRKEIVALVGKERADGVGLWVDLVRAPPSGTWERRRADLLALAGDWVGGVGPGDLTLDLAIGHLVRRYLAGFGPASRDDV